MKIQVSTISLSSVSFQCLPLAKPNQHQWRRDLIDTACRGQREEGKRMVVPTNIVNIHIITERKIEDWGRMLTCPHEGSLAELT